MACYYEKMGTFIRRKMACCLVKRNIFKKERHVSRKRAHSLKGGIFLEKRAKKVSVWGFMAKKIRVGR